MTSLEKFTGLTDGRRVTPLGEACRSPRPVDFSSEAGVDYPVETSSAQCLREAEAVFPHLPADAVLVRHSCDASLEPLIVLHH